MLICLVYKLKKRIFFLAHSEFTVLLYFLVSTCVMIGQFSRPYFTVQPAKLKKICLNGNPPPLIEPKDIINILLTLFFPARTFYFFIIEYMAHSCPTQALTLSLPRSQC